MLQRIYEISTHAPYRFMPIKLNLDNLDVQMKNDQVFF